MGNFLCEAYNIIVNCKTEDVYDSKPGSFACEVSESPLFSSPPPPAVSRLSFLSSSLFSFSFSSSSPPPGPFSADLTSLSPCSSTSILTPPPSPTSPPSPISPVWGGALAEGLGSTDINGELIGTPDPVGLDEVLSDSVLVDFPPEPPSKVFNS